MRFKNNVRVGGEARHPIENRLESYSGGELQAARSISRGCCQRLAERWIGCGIPKIQAVARAVSPLSEGVLHIVDDPLLKVGVVEDVERIRPQSETYSFAKFEGSDNTEVHVLHPSVAEGVEALSRYDGKIDLGCIKDGGIGTTAGESCHGAEHKPLQESDLWSPGTACDKPLGLVQLRQATL
jgi:hypothetical protein